MMMSWERTDFSEGDKVASEADVDFSVECGSNSERVQVNEGIIGIVAQVQLEPLDCMDDGESIGTLTEDEYLVLSRLQEIYQNEETIEIPSLKGRYRRAMMCEVNMVNKVAINIKLDQVDVTSVNKLLYACSFVVCERLGLMKKRKESLKSRKP